MAARVAPRIISIEALMPSAVVARTVELRGVLRPPTTSSPRIACSTAHVSVTTRAGTMQTDNKLRRGGLRSIAVISNPSTTSKSLPRDSAEILTRSRTSREGVGRVQERCDRADGKGRHERNDHPFLAARMQSL